jgi:hypothetical protein
MAETSAGVFWDAGESPASSQQVWLRPHATQCLGIRAQWGVRYSFERREES